MEMGLAAKDDLRLHDVRLRILNNLHLIGTVLKLRRKQAVTADVQDELGYMERLLRDVARKCETGEGDRFWDTRVEARLRHLQNQLDGNFDLLLSVLLVRERQHPDRVVRAELRRMQHLVRLVSELQDRPRADARRDFVEFLDGAVNLWNNLAWDSGIRISYHPVAPLSVSGELATLLGVVVFETLCNSVEHAYPAGGPGLVTVTLKQTGPDTARLIIWDDGVGFRAFADEDGDGGQAMVRRLVKSIGGIMYVHSGPGQGTETTICIPLNPRKGALRDGRY